MKLLKKLGAGFFLILGLMITPLTIAELLNPNLDSEYKKDSAAALWVVGIPSTLLGSWLAWSLIQENQKQKRLSEENRQNQLQSVFYSLLEQKSGEISVLDFAKEAQITGEEAKIFLDAKATEFNADFEVSEKGIIYYHFS